MSIWSRLFAWWHSSDGDTPSSGDETSTDVWETLSEMDDHCPFNPATGLPMMGGCGGVDVAGNPYGTDMHDWHSSDSVWHDADSSFDHWADHGSWSGGLSGWDD